LQNLFFYFYIYCSKDEFQAVADLGFITWVGGGVAENFNEVPKIPPHQEFQGGAEKVNGAPNLLI